MNTEDSIIERVNGLLPGIDIIKGNINIKDSGYFTIFIIGAPRSGTTLVYQTLVSSLKVGYPTNLIARFWTNPVIGYAVQKVLIEETSNNFISSFRSSNGYTENAILEPHEFGYFWSRWFDHSKSHYTPVNAHVRNELVEEINALMNLSESNWVFKNLTLGMKIPLMKKIFPKSKFIFVKRDPLYTAYSLLRGKIKRYNDKNHWWSLMPKEIVGIKKLPAEEQIVAQIYFTNTQIEADLRELNSNDYIITEYEEFCCNPNRFCRDIEQKWNLDGKNNLPDSFCVSKVEIETKLETILSNYIKKYFG